MTDRYNDQPAQPEYGHEPNLPEFNIPRRSSRNEDAVINDDDAIVAGGPVAAEDTPLDDASADVIAVHDAVTGLHEDEQVPAEDIGEIVDQAAESTAPEQQPADSDYVESPVAQPHISDQTPAHHYDSEPVAEHEPKSTTQIPTTGPIPVVSAATDAPAAEPEQGQVPNGLADIPATQQDLSETDADDAAMTNDEADLETAAAAGAAAQVGRTSLRSRAAEGAAQDAAGDVETTLVRRQSLLNSSSVPAEGQQGSPNWAPRQSPTAGQTDKTETGMPPVPAGGQKPLLDGAMFEGATVAPTVPRRVGARLWSLLLSIITLPIAWYFLIAYTDTYMTAGQLGHSFPLGWTDMAKLVIGLVALLVLLIQARWSSLGAFFTGIVTLIIAMPFFIIPGKVATQLNSMQEPLANSTNPSIETLRHVLQYATDSGYSGLFLVIGLGLIFLGIVSFGARRAGRKDMSVRRVVAAADSNGSF